MRLILDDEENSGISNDEVHNSDQASTHVLRVRADAGYSSSQGTTFIKPFRMAGESRWNHKKKLKLFQFISNTIPTNQN